MATTDPIARAETVAGEVIQCIAPADHGQYTLAPDLRQYAAGAYIAVVDDERLWSRTGRLQWFLNFLAGVGHPDPPPKVLLDEPVPERSTIRVTTTPARVAGKVYEPVGDVEVVA